MKKIKTLLEMTAFLTTMLGLISLAFNSSSKNLHPSIPATAAPDIFHKEVTVINHDQPMPALLNSKYIVINY